MGRRTWQVCLFSTLPTYFKLCCPLSYIRNKHAYCRWVYDWPDETVEDLSHFRDYFPIIQRMQTWMHYVSRYDGWSENDHLKETSDAILARRKWMQNVTESMFVVMSSWDGGLNYKYVDSSLPYNACLLWR